MVNKETVLAKLKLKSSDKSLDDTANDLRNLGFIVRTLTDKGQIVQDELSIESAQELFERIFQTKLKRNQDKYFNLVNYELINPISMPDYLQSYVSEVSIFCRDRALSEFYQNL